jgi:dynein heavy chain
LGIEKFSWKRKATDFHAQGLCIFGDCMLASAFISYMGVFPMMYRDECLAFWKERLTMMGIRFSPDFGLQQMLSDPMKVGQWTNQEKLPNDSFSIDNAIILKNSTRWPLLIDPQLQGHIWIKNMESKRNLLVLRATQTP